MATLHQQAPLVTDWQSTAVPPTIRRPWRVFEEDIEDKLADSASQGEPAAQATRDKLSSVQARGAMAAFAALDEEEQRNYTEVSIMELAAFVKWRRALAARQQTSDEPAATELESAWDALDVDQKGEWVPEDPRAMLSADGQFAALLAHGGVLISQAAHDKGTGVNAPAAKPLVKSELTAPAKKVVVKSELAAPAEKPATSDSAVAAPAATGGGPEAAVPLPPPPSVVKKEMQPMPTPVQAAAEAVTKSAAQPAEEAPAPKALLDTASEPKKAPPPTEEASEPPASECLAREAIRLARKAATGRGRNRGAPTRPPAATRHSRRINHDSDAEDEAREARERAVDEKEAALQVAKAQGKTLVEEAAECVPGTEQALGGRPRRACALAAVAASTPAPVPTRQGGIARRISMKGKLAPENMFPEALNANCCKCGKGEATDDNDLALCDRCDRAFHQFCHDPPVERFGNAEDQWFCMDCTKALSKLRELRLGVGAFAWVQTSGDPHPWPAKVLRLDFSSLADPKPYWVQYCDTGAPQGNWVGEKEIIPWEEGPSFDQVLQARRRNAVRLAEGAGAPPISNVASRSKSYTAPVSRVSQSSRTAPGKKRGADPAASANVQKRQRRRRATEEEDDEEEEEEDPQQAEQVLEMRRLIQEARERQRALERQIDEEAPDKAGDDDLE
eukprot:TRINITY_DN105808_c0_g1_i1.p1 TRINITY_DN105808_c0_g1~~TRINITY_DN105808_c0_g1_i1.p1  ORF type:complete len:701 (+),score=159.39 TRINITY_DN105808_c0_g1_i1:76-2103(+)